MTPLVSRLVMMNEWQGDRPRKVGGQSWLMTWKQGVDVMWTRPLGSPDGSLMCGMMNVAEWDS